MKGSVYIIYLAPTYVNILSIYAISNIHNITWGSRPDVKDDKSKFNKIEEKFVKTEKELKIDYKNFRSNFLIFWLIVNIFIGNSVTLVSRENNQFILFCLAYFLFGVMAFKILFSSFYIVKQWLTHCCYKNSKGTYFKDVSLLSRLF